MFLCVCVCFCVCVPGGVLGLVATPFIAQVCGFSSTFLATGLAGALWAVGSWLWLPHNEPDSKHVSGTGSSPSSSSALDGSSRSSGGGIGSYKSDSKGGAAGLQHLDVSNRRNGAASQHGSGEASTSGTHSSLWASSQVRRKLQEDLDIGQSLANGSNSGSRTNASEARNGANGQSGIDASVMTVRGIDRSGEVARSRESERGGRGSKQVGGDAGWATAVGAAPGGAAVAFADPTLQQQQQQQQLLNVEQCRQEVGSAEQADASQSLASQPEVKPSQKQQQQSEQAPILAQVLVLCWAHAVMGWGFFIFQRCVCKCVVHASVCYNL